MQRKATPPTLRAGARRWPRPPLRVWVWVALTVVIAVGLALLWRGSDAAATTSTTAPAPAPLTGSPASTLSRAWTADGGPLPGRVVERDRVIVGSAHGVAALDPVTGRQVWHYTRSNARLCGVTAVDKAVVAVFQVPHETGRCDQAVALNAATGVRNWTRNVNFRPEVALTSTEGTVLASSSTGLVAVDPVGDSERWRWSVPSGCRIGDVAAGTAGLAVVQVCPGQPGRVRMLDAGSGSTRWTAELGDVDAGALRLAGADDVVTLVAGDRLEVLAGDDGRVLQRLPLATGSAGRALEAASGNALVTWIAGTAYSLDPATGALRWQRPAAGLPAVLGDGSTVLVPEDGAFVERDTVTGDERHRSTVSALPAGGSTEVVGPVVVYRLAGRVIGYR